MRLFRDPDRPPLLSVVFWAVFAATAAIRLLVFPDEGSTPLFCLVMTVVAVLWLMLPWSPAASHWRKPAALCFLVAVAFIGTFTQGIHSALMLIGIANLAFLYGVRLAAFIVVVYFTVLCFTSPSLFGRPWPGVLLEAGIMGVLSAFALGMASAILEARRKGEVAQRLLERVRELAVAEERARMARDMHDSVGHHLTVIKMGLENAERYRERRPYDAWDEVRQAKQVTAQALAEARRWVRALRPLALDDHVGSAALNRLAQSFAGTGIQVSFEVHGDEQRLDPDSELVLYRVLQEGLTNALRHAEAKHVRARLAFGTGRVVLVIGDDGKGTEETAGFGLSSLAERAHAIGGSLRAGNADGGGFEVRAEVPVTRS
ncbi:sensor histidine kinase [Streptosporangium sp. NPDC000396]|uniref:sensor histidine kinase n=1 Tax=Streptosporangium sp. NPDC000396 TaxID=3366185 RepID=UPI0036BBC3F3